MPWRPRRDAKRRSRIVEEHRRLDYPGVRLAAVRALGRVGDASAVEGLLGSAGAADADLQKAARAALVDELYSNSERVLWI